MLQLLHQPTSFPQDGKNEFLSNTLGRQYEVRVFWNGDELRTTSSRLNIPTWFKNQLPKISLEADLITTDARNIDWHCARLVAFDSPLMYIESYEERIKVLRDRIQHSDLLTITLQIYHLQMQ